MLSKELGISDNKRINFELYIKYLNKQIALTEDEKQEYSYMVMISHRLVKEGTIDDVNAIMYLKQYFDYFCEFPWGELHNEIKRSYVYATKGYYGELYKEACYQALKTCPKEFYDQLDESGKAVAYSDEV